ncbi:MAG: recombinase family protein [Acetatifactor sp.]|nr:recombinase family protein [Acetatifactor sp.]
MARISRKTASVEQDVTICSERAYQTAVYVRLSVVGSDLGQNQDSIEMQRYMLEKYVETQPDMRLVEVFCDNGETGTNFDRPGFELMMDAVRSRAVDCIVVKDLSRFGRNYVETGYYLEKIFPRLGVRFVAVNDQYDTLKAGAGNDLVYSIKNLVNDLYARDISLKVNSSLAVKRERGAFVGAIAPYGYMKSAEDRHKLVVDADAAPIVRDIFRWRLEGEGFARIARRLNDAGVPSPAAYRYEKGYLRDKPSNQALLWKALCVQRMTANPAYAGHMAQGKTKKPLAGGLAEVQVPADEWVVVRNTHEALVSQEDFDRVQAMADECRRKYCSLRGKHATTENVFKGLLVCADCGVKMVRHKNVTPKGTARYSFGCLVYAQNLGGQGCSHKYVREPELAEAVALALRVQVQLALDMEEVLGKVWKQRGCQTKDKELDCRIGKLQAGIKRNAALRGTLFESYTEHTLTEKEYVSMKAEYDREAQELKEKLSILEKEKQEAGRVYENWEGWINTLKKYQDFRSVTREMAVELISCIRVSGHHELEIVWNFQDVFAGLMAEWKGAGA